MCTGKFEEAQGYTGKLEEVRAKLSGSSKEFIFRDNSMSARRALYILVCPATPISVQLFCFSVAVSQTLKYDRM